MLGRPGGYMLVTIIIISIVIAIAIVIITITLDIVSLGHRVHSCSIPSVFIGA